MTNANHTITTGQERMASAIARRLGAPVTFLRWEATRVRGQEQPVFAVPAEYVDRAGEFGLSAGQFVADPSVHTWDGPAPEVLRDADGAPLRRCAGEWRE